MVIFRVCLIILIIFPRYGFASLRKVKEKNNSQITMEADHVSTVDQSDRLKLYGGVVLQKDQYMVYSNELTYDQKSKVIYSDNKSNLLLPTGDLIFSDKSVVTDDLASGEFKDSGIISRRDITILAKQIDKVGDNLYIAKDSTYYVCPNRNLDTSLSYDQIIKDIKKSKKNIFSVRSKKSRFDLGKKRIYVTHSTVRFFDIPFFYIPYFSVSQPFVDRVSGFDFPRFEHQSGYGGGVYMPYNWYTKDNTKIRFEPVIYQYGSLALKVKQKSFFDEGHLHSKIVFIYDNHIFRDKKNARGITEKEDRGYKNFRGYFHIAGKGALSDNWFYGTNIEYATDNYIYRDYLKEYDNSLKSKIKFFWVDFDQFNYVKFNILSFEEIAEGARSRQKISPRFLPEISWHKYWSMSSKGGKSANFIINGRVLTTRIFNFNTLKYDKLNIDPNINYYFNIHGLILKLNTSFYMDFYKLRKESIPFVKEREVFRTGMNRFLPEVSFDARIPYILFNNTNIIFEPIVQYYFTPKLDNCSKHFLGGDSEFSEITMLNLFTGDRYNGPDRREQGSRINYGFKSKILSKYGDFGFSLGQAYRELSSYEDDIRGFNKHFSDILTGISYAYAPFSLHVLMNFDKDSYAIKSNETVLGFNYNKTTIFINHVYANNKVRLFHSDKLNQIRLGINQALDSKWDLGFSFNNDLRHKTVVQLNTELSYTNDCLRLGLRYKRDSYRILPRADHSLKLYLNLLNGSF